MKKALLISLRDPGFRYTNPILLQRIGAELASTYNITLVDEGAEQELKSISPTFFDICIWEIEPKLLDRMKKYLEEFPSFKKSTKHFIVGLLATAGDHKSIMKKFSSWHSTIQLVPSYDVEKILPALGVKSKKPENRLIFNKEILEYLQLNADSILIDGVSIGCEMHCLFCHLNASQQTSGFVKEISTNKIAELISLLSKEVSQNLLLQFADENFFGGSNNSERLAKIIDFAGILGKNQRMMRYGVDTRCDTILNMRDTPSIAKLRAKAFSEMRAAGLEYVFLGIESFARSQAKRYGKAFNPDEARGAIDILLENNMNFTIGLILNDPLVSEQEISENKRLIEDLDIGGFCASPIKPMRIIQNSPYYRLCQNQIIQNTSEDFIHVDRHQIKYACEGLQKNKDTIFKISDIFRNSGYYHSDVARWSKNYIDTPLFYFHKKIVHWELEILQKSSQGENISLFLELQHALGLVKDVRNKIDKTSFPSSIITQLHKELDWEISSLKTN